MCINDSTCPLKLGEGAGDLVFHWQCRWEAMDRRVRPRLAFVPVSYWWKPAFKHTLYLCSYRIKQCSLIHSIVFNSERKKGFTSVKLINQTLIATKRIAPKTTTANALLSRTSPFSFGQWNLGGDREKNNTKTLLKLIEFSCGYIGRYNKLINARRNP